MNSVLKTLHYQSVIECQAQRVYFDVDPMSNFQFILKESNHVT
jgi:hypothetical protein